MTFKIGLDSQTLFGMPPLEHIKLAARCGCDFISLAHGPVPWMLSRFQPWSLREDQQLRRDVKSLLRGEGIGLELAEGFVIRAGQDIAEREADLDMFADLGARKVAAVTMEADPARAVDQLFTLFAMAEPRGLEVAYEFAPPHTFNSLKAVCEVIKASNAKNVGLLIDAMHYFRCGETVSELKQVYSDISYVQLSDTPLHGTTEDYYKEASFRRLAPGQGELDLVRLLASVPPDVPIGLEIPMQDRLSNEHHLEQLVEQLVADTKVYLSKLPVGLGLPLISSSVHGSE